MSSWHQPTPEELLALVATPGAWTNVRVKSGKTNVTVVFRFRCRVDGKRAFIDVRRDDLHNYVGWIDVDEMKFTHSEVAHAASAFDHQVGSWLAEAILAKRSVGAEVNV